MPSQQYQGTKASFTITLTTALWLEQYPASFFNNFVTSEPMLISFAISNPFVATYKWF